VPVKFSITKRLKSFNYAFSGIITLFSEEHNSRIHAASSLLVIIMGIAFDISRIEWALILFAIGFVICLEIINTVAENLSDIISPEKKRKKSKKIKDLSAAAVLLAAFIALVIGIIIFLPKIYIYVSSL
jgi:diacylglycerol kinase